MNYIAMSNKELVKETLQGINKVVYKRQINKGSVNTVNQITKEVKVS